MLIKQKTLEELRHIINGDGTTHYRSGPKLVSFFRNLGFNDSYRNGFSDSSGNGFQSRKYYTDDRLQKLNGTPELGKCIKMTFDVIDFINNIDELDRLIQHFNQYLAFDRWQIVRDNDTITIVKVAQLVIDSNHKISLELKEENFLRQIYDINVDKLNLDATISEIIKYRIGEIESCINDNIPLAAIFMIGSTLEGILVGIAISNYQQFNQATCAPLDKANGKVRKIQNWTLSNMIDVATELGILRHDVQKFSHALRDFRNYIHPYQQMKSNFTPDMHTALICFQVLKAAMYQIGNYKN